MNKQAITFLSLFTLILVLSIYYLLVPPIDQSDTVSKKSLSRIEILQSELNKNKGYKECFCEIDGGHMKVVVKLKDATSKDANKIIKLIHNKYNGYIIEVKFVED